MPDAFGFMAAAGGALFDNLPLIFAIGVAIGISKDGNGVAELSGAVGYLVLTNASKFIWIQNYGEELAKNLKFDSFGGIHGVGAGGVGLGAGIFALLNRLLIPMGLHHVLNSFFWFTLGEYNGKVGDIARFFEGDPTAGTYMAGFFPVMMFGLPAVTLAIYFAVDKNKKISLEECLLV